MLLMAGTAVGKAGLAFRAEAVHVPSTSGQVNEYSLLFLPGRTGWEGCRGMKW